ncbi:MULTISPECIES: hypothetical protein [Sphingobacterium]|uniref:hypothetical protein n=1 Tax=Sphingobacterium TaxID=28453 RepID=UPI0013DA7802|nr:MULTISPECIES: hypothetical protein [unclassified Sphingobacterium]
MKLETIKATTREQILKDVDDTAKQLLNQVLQIGKSIYRLTEIEFYIKTKNNDLFNDPYIYGHDLQLQTGKLYAHASGIDITLGNDDLYVGVLLRGIAKLRDERSSDTDSTINEHYNLEKIISGPHKVATELISNLSFDTINTLSWSEFNERALEPFAVTTKTTRHGLSKQEDDFYNLPLRYIGFYPIDVVKAVNKDKNFTLANREKIVIDEMNKREKIDTDLVRSVLGYVPSVLK